MHMVQTDGCEMEATRKMIDRIKKRLTKCINNNVHLSFCLFCSTGIGRFVLFFFHFFFWLNKRSPLVLCALSFWFVCASHPSQLQQWTGGEEERLMCACSSRLKERFFPFVNFFVVVYARDKIQHTTTKCVTCLRCDRCSHLLLNCLVEQQKNDEETKGKDTFATQMDDTLSPFPFDLVTSILFTIFSSPERFHNNQQN